MLVGGVALLVAVDLIILIIYTIVQGVRGQLGSELVKNRENAMYLMGVSDVASRLITVVLGKSSKIYVHVRACSNQQFF